MINTVPEITPEVKRLLDMECEMITAKDIAPVLKMSESVIIHYAKTGHWTQETLGNFVISGNRVKFFRVDCLQKWGFLPKPKKRPVEDLLVELNEGVTMICQMLTLMMKPYQLDALNELIEKKSAGAATPTE